MSKTNRISEVQQVFCEVEYVGKYISETKATCQWVLAFRGDMNEKVSFTVHDSTISGKKEIFKDGTSIYARIESHHSREAYHQNCSFSLTLDYYCYCKQHIIHIQILQYNTSQLQECRKKGIMSLFAPRVFRLFVDGINFEILPSYFKDDSHFPNTNELSYNPSSFSTSVESSSLTLSTSNSNEQNRSRSRETGYYTIPIRRVPMRKILDQQYSQPVWLVGRIDSSYTICFNQSIETK